MAHRARLCRLGVLFTTILFCSTAPRFALAQADDERMTGPAAAAWTKWQTAIDALSSRNAAAAETAIGELLALDPSPFRVALLAERTEMRARQGGVLLALEQDVSNGSAGDNAKKLWALLETGKEQMNQADDGWYFSSVGQFGVASANFTALVAASPDPVALLEFSDRVQRRQQILVTLAGDPTMGESVRGVLKLLAEGERRIKADPTRIKQHIERLGGAPRAFENAVAALKDSGEFAVPFLFQALRDPAMKRLTQSILRTLPQLDRAALNPLVMALRTDDQSTLLVILSAIGDIPYYQSAPYLIALRDADKTTPDIRAAADAALARLASRGVAIRTGLTADEAFYDLAKAYYEDRPVVAADGRLSTANVWYYRDGMLQNVEIPTAIYNEVMTMRCCEEALRQNAELKPALALWLAANARREAQLSDGATDYTRTDNYPSAAYFAQAAGAEYNLIALARAIDDGDSVVALASIAALRATAGTSSSLGRVGERLPMPEALTFPERVVRVRAGLALAAAKPAEPFEGYQNLMPVLVEALSLHAGSSNALVVDGDDVSGNHFVSLLRGASYNAIADTNLFNGLSRARRELPSVDVILVASDLSTPGLTEALKAIRSEYQFRFTPVLIVTKKGDRDRVSDLVRTDSRSGAVAIDAGGEGLLASIGLVTKAAGATSIGAELGTSLALEAAQALLGLATSNNPVFRIGDAEPALTSLVRTTDPALRITAAGVLVHIASASAQSTIADVALATAEAEPVRGAMFEALSDSAKLHGPLIDSDRVRKLIDAAEAEANLTIRTAAARALGAMNFEGNPASTIVRNQYGG